MSSANAVPETWELTGADAKETLAHVGYRRLTADAFRRFRASDGFSHARSMAFVTSLILVQGVIALVGLASALDDGGVSDTIVAMFHGFVPGPAGAVLTDAVEQAHRAGAHHRSLALVLGLTGALITGTTLLGQIERAMNRLYGIERDRPTAKKYGRAFLLTISAGVLAAAAFVAMTLGRGLGDTEDGSFSGALWTAGRWAFAFALLVGATACVYRWSPRRRQPGWSWLSLGAGISVTLVLVETLILNAVFEVSATFGQTYGPLAGFVALLVWALVSSIALLFGAAMSAQLEAVRAGVPAPRRDADADGSRDDSPVGERAAAPAPTPGVPVPTAP